MRLGPQPEYVDPARTHLNRVLIAPLTNQKLKGEWEALKDLVGKKGKIRSNQNLSYAGIITFGTEAQKIFESLDVAKQDAALQEVAQKIAARFETDLTGLVYHGDESAPHAHFQLRGIADDGTPLSQIVKRAALRDIQDIAAEVMGRHAPGIERGRAKAKRLKDGEDYAATVNRSVKQLHDDLPAEIAAKENELADLEEKIAEAEAERDSAEERRATNEQRAEKARAKAKADESRAEKALKNAETYEKRADDAQGAAQRATERLTDLRDEETRLTASMERLRASEAALRASEADAKEELETVSNAVAQKKTKIAALQASNSGLRQRKDDLQSRLKTLNAA